MSHCACTKIAACLFDPDDGTCTCGGRSVVRQGKHGEFYGCSNFPKCKHTENPHRGIASDDYDYLEAMTHDCGFK